MSKHKRKNIFLKWMPKKKKKKNYVANETLTARLTDSYRSQITT